MLNVKQVKEIAAMLKEGGETDKEVQASILGYTIGLCVPVNLDVAEADDNVEWDKFFNDIAGEVNEYYMMNLEHVKNVAKLTLDYRQAVINGSQNIDTLAQKFLKVTGSAFGLLGSGGLVNRIRNALNTPTEERVNQIRERIETRRRSQAEE